MAWQLQKRGYQVKILFRSIEPGKAADLLARYNLSFATIGIVESHYDILYAWNCRPGTRTAVENYTFSRLVVHMEDNEYLISKQDHPQSYLREWLEIDEFLNRADFVTSLNSNCAALIPTKKSHLVLVPGLDDMFFESKVPISQLKNTFEFEYGDYLLYTGNVTSYVYNGLSIIGTAIERYNKKNNKNLFLVITGKDWTNKILLEHPHSIILGNFLEREVVSTLLNSSIANVQGQSAKVFDQYRFPSKLTEYLISDSIILTSYFDIDFPLINNSNCILVADSTVLAWENAIEHVMRLSFDDRFAIISNATKMGFQVLSWEKSADKLDAHIKSLVC
jgi:hypothetical protein